MIRIKAVTPATRYLKAKLEVSPVVGTPIDQRPVRPHLIRHVGIGVAMVEVAFLTVWMGLVFGLMDGLAPYLWSLGPVLLDSMPALIAGMTVAALLGATAGLLVAVVRDAVSRLAVARARRSPD